jgi:hypothetical protein
LKRLAEQGGELVGQVLGDVDNGPIQTLDLLDQGDAGNGQYHHDDDEQAEVNQGRRHAPR